MNYSNPVILVIAAILAVATAQDLAADAPAAADAGGSLVTVVVTGVGLDEQGAKREALRAAVHQAAGEVVSAETLVKDDQVIQDKVLVYSDGIVKQFDLVRPARKEAA